MPVLDEVELFTDMIIEIFLFTSTLVLIFIQLTRKPAKFPPGPPLWPIIGNRIQIKSWGRLIHQSMAEATRHYGDVVGLYSGQNPIILVSSLKGIKEVSSRDDMAGRPLNILQTDIDKGFYGVLSISGEKWKDQRRFTLRHLKDLGFGKRSLEGIAHEELQAVFNEIEKSAGGQAKDWAMPIQVHDILGTAGINVLWHIVAGKRYGHSDPYLNKLISNVRTITGFSEPSGGSASAFPWFAKLFPSLTLLPKFLELRGSVENFIKEEIKLHKEMLDHNHPRDFMDVYLTEMENQKDNSSPWYEEKQLIRILMDIFFAGSDTTFNSITFSLLYMVLYPDVQRKVQDELDKIAGRDRLPSLEDRHRLHYVEATLHEVLRISSVAPLAIAHCNPFHEKDVEFQGYILPKNSRIILNLHGLHHDPKIWGDPYIFRPERFLDENGKFFKHESLLPFGAGKRVCLGESLARNNLFIFFSGLMQRYSMKVPDGHPLPSEDPDGSFTLVPKPFEVQIRIRN